MVINMVENNMITLEHVSRRFSVAGGEFHALSDVNIQIPAGKLTVLKGKSGSGKTTLLNIIGALDKPTCGEVSIDGQRISNLSDREKENIRRKQIGFVFQSVSLIPTMNAFQNVEFSLRLAGVKKDREERVKECLKLVGLEARMTHMPAEMSGGEQQRVAIARALVHRPKIILADEPTAELDSSMSAEVTRILVNLTEKEEITILMTTHDVGLMDAGSMVIELEAGRVVVSK